MNLLGAAKIKPMISHGNSAATTMSKKGWKSVRAATHKISFNPDSNSTSQNNPFKLQVQQSTYQRKQIVN